MMSNLTIHDGQLFSVGSFSGTCSFATGSPAEADLVAGTAGAIFIERADLDGHAGAAIFLNSTGPSGAPPARTQPSAVVVGAEGIYVSGTFSGEVDFDPGPALSLRRGALSHPFVLKLTKEGAFSWIRSIQGGTAGLLLMPNGGVLAVGESVKSIVQNGSFGWTRGPSTLTALNADGSAGWTLKVDVRDVRALASNSEQVLLAGQTESGCGDPITRLAWTQR
jgi:hypothetical protein